MARIGHSQAQAVADVAIDHDGAHLAARAVVHRIIEADPDLSVDRKFRLDLDQGGEVTQQPVTLVQEFRGLPIERAVFEQLLVHYHDLFGEGIDFLGCGRQALARFVVDQVQLGRQLTKARGSAIGLPQETAAGNNRGGFDSQIARGREERCERGCQPDILVGHEIHDPAGVLHQRSLPFQVTVTVAQIRFDESVVLPAYRLQTHTGTDEAVAHLPGLIGSESNFLSCVAIRADVGNVVGDSRQGALVSRDAGTAQG